jgi:hypothetical protein
MSDKAEYKVSFGVIARTVLYEDREGIIRFTFDVDTADGRNIIFLERNAKGLSPEARVREDMVAERVKEHLISVGYEVRFFPPG